MSKYSYTSVLKDEMNGFVRMRDAQGFRDGHRFILASLDKYLFLQRISDKALTPYVVDAWLAYGCNGQSNRTMNNYIGYYNSFAKYLHIMGIDVFVPEYVRVHEDYTPYIFSEEEISRIFSVADNINQKRYVTANIQFPILLRLLYGCGLRLGEALELTKGDIDLNNGTLFIRSAKGNRDRFVPMDCSLTITLSQYNDKFLSDKPDDAWVFESDLMGEVNNCVGKPLTPKWAQEHFRRVLDKAGIELPELPRKKRNICLHCLRHTFIVRSFRKQDLMGIDNYDPAASISVYVGHYRLSGTQRYLHMTAENSKDIINSTNTYSKGMFPKTCDKPTITMTTHNDCPVVTTVPTEPEYCPNICSIGIFPEVPQ